MKTSEYEYCWFPFEEWNPVQEKCLEYLTQDCNLVLGASVASGKTAVAEAIMGYELRVPGSRVVYVSPLRSIGLEKYESWRRHPTFQDMETVILDGDHRCAEEELERSRIVVSTIESLHIASRRREKWLRDVRLLVFDEAHLFDSEDRGSASEGMMMDFSAVCPGSRLVCLSGTMPNCIDIARWLKVLNGKRTGYVTSSWRPTRLVRDYVELSTFGERVDYIAREKRPGEKMLVFVHSRRLGDMMRKSLAKKGVRCAFFHANMEADARKALLERYRSASSGLDLLIATSSLGMGVSL